MAENIINKFLQLDNPDIARQTRNMSYGDAFKTENPFSKSYQGYRPGYTGADKVGLGGYVKQGINSLTGNFQQGSNVGGATSLTRKLAQDTMRFAPKALGTLASLPAQAALMTLSSTPANADEANMTPEDFAALAEAEGMTYGSSPITSSPFVDAGRDFSMFDQARMGNSRTNVQGMDLEMDPAAQEGFLNPDIQPSQNMFQRAGSAIKEGIGSLTELELEDYLPFIGEKSLTGMAMGGVGKVGRGILSLFNAPYRGATRGGGGYTIDQLNRQNARGGYYTDTARSQRRDAASIQNMINRAASGKNYGANRLNTLGKEAGMSSEDISRAITDRKTAAPSHIGNENTTGTGGGKIVCTMMNDSYGFGSFRNKIWMKFHKDIAPEYQKGYHKLFLPLVKIAKTNKIVKKVLEHIAVHSTIDMRQATRGKIHLLGRVYRKIIKPICFIVGKALMFRQKR